MLRDYEDIHIKTPRKTKIHFVRTVGSLAEIAADRTDGADGAAVTVYDRSGTLL
jgi:hypothetical protein